MNLGYAVLFYMHEQGMEYGPELSVVYDQFATESDVDSLVDKAIEITGTYDEYRYNRSSYMVVDVSRLHHEINLDMVDKDLKYRIRRVCPEIYQYAKMGCTGNGGSMIRKTIGWDQWDANMKYWASHEK